MHGEDAKYLADPILFSKVQSSIQMRRDLQEISRVQHIQMAAVMQPTIIHRGSNKVESRLASNTIRGTDEVKSARSKKPKIKSVDRSKHISEAKHRTPSWKLT